jgi:hypothetical protein
LAQLPNEVFQMKGMLRVIPEILAMEQLQLIGNQGIIALPQDRGDRLVGVERELPFLPHETIVMPCRPTTSLPNVCNGGCVSGS